MKKATSIVETLVDGEPVSPHVAELMARGNDRIGKLEAEVAQLRGLVSECRLLVDRMTIITGYPIPEDRWVYVDLLRRIDAALEVKP